MGAKVLGEVQVWSCIRQPGGDPRLLSWMRCVEQTGQDKVCSDLVTRNMGGSQVHRCGLLPYHHLLLVFWPPARLYFFFPLPPFISSLSCVLLGVSRPPAVLVCLSGMNGSTLWSSPLPEEARDITCLDLMPGSMAGTICLVTGMNKMLSAFNATSGEDHLPQKSSAPVSHGLGLEQSGRGGPSTLTGWKI